ncbi:MerR family DNA-binding transcriptional regulator [Streptosporangium algeriense]|uniref:MerR family DNA-binding transcriptional regulator n=1 Tax=Streptosporangium algeriense TaxID=1682748 RepID=A0ABW3DMZ3_9ACTN
MIVSPDGTFTIGAGDTERLLTRGEVARLFGVDPKTVNRWALRGQIASVRTPSGHRRHRAGDARVLLQGSESGAQDGSTAEPPMMECL